MAFGTNDYNPLENTDSMSKEAEKALADQLHAMMNTQGWAWFEAHCLKMIEAQHKSIENAELDEKLPMKIAENRGAARGIRQMLMFPRNTVGALLANLNPDPILGGQPEMKPGSGS